MYTILSEKEIILGGKPMTEYRVEFSCEDWKEVQTYVASEETKEQVLGDADAHYEAVLPKWRTDVAAIRKEEEELMKAFLAKKKLEAEEAARLQAEADAQLGFIGRLKKAVLS